MDDLEATFRQDTVPEWSSSYIAYTSLQQRVEEAAKMEDVDDRQRLKDDFQAAFDSEIKKVLAFYKEHTEKVQQELRDLASGSVKDLKKACKHIRDLLQFISINTRGLRKILNNFDHRLDAEAPEDGCVTLEVERPHHPGHNSFQGTSLPKKVAEQLDDMLEHQPLLSAAGLIKQKYTLLQKKGAEVEADVLADLRAAVHEMDGAAGKAERNTDLVHTLSRDERYAGIYEKAPSNDKTLGGWVGLAINCASAALYMANYQLVLPDMETYLSHIGSQPSWAGIAIGCCDVATLPGAIGYSLWTNHSFKLPLLAGAVACILGNCLYSMGYDARALWLLLVSRLVVGLGSARTVNRRYIADFVSKDNRTKASAAFVTSSAVGMACGPLLALPLSYIPSTSLGKVSVDKITAGGYVMSLIWAVFLAAVLVFFKEPKTSDDRGSDGDIEGSQHRQSLLHDQAGSSDVENGQANGSKDQDSDSSDEDEGKTWKSQLQPTLLMFFTLFLVKLVQQGFLSSLSTFTTKIYGWTASESGLTLAVFGFGLIPVNFGVGKASAYTSDKVFSAVLLCVIIAGSGVCICAGNPMWLFLLGGAFVFTGSMTLEGSAMSLLSKVMAPSLAEGTFNTGLLTTEAGGLGRLAGNLAVAGFSKLAGSETPSQVFSFGRYLFGTLTLVVFGNAVYFGGMWAKIQE